MFVIVGFAALLFLFSDAFVTVFSTKGAGPVTRAWTKGVWKLLLRMHQRRPMHRLLSLMGPLMLVGVIVVWYLWLALGWFLIFAAESTSVYKESTGKYGSPLETLYFVGTTVSGLGYGDFTPPRFPWTIASNLAVLSGTILLTTSLSYILPVLSAAVERKSLAEQVFGLGKTSPQFIRRAWVGDSRGELNTYIAQTASDIGLHAHKYLAYPILLYFHSADPKKSPSRAVLHLSDVLFLASHGIAREHRPSRGVVEVVQESIDNYAELTESGVAAPDDIPGTDMSHLNLEAVRSLGVPAVDEAEFGRALQDYLSRRERLVQLCWGDGWRHR